MVLENGTNFAFHNPQFRIIYINLGSLIAGLRSWNIQKKNTWRCVAQGDEYVILGQRIFQKVFVNGCWISTVLPLNGDELFRRWTAFWPRYRHRGVRFGSRSISLRYAECRYTSSFNPLPLLLNKREREEEKNLSVFARLRVSTCGLDEQR